VRRRRGIRSEAPHRKVEERKLTKLARCHVAVSLWAFVSTELRAMSGSGRRTDFAARIQITAHTNDSAIEIGFQGQRFY
jgi:hypothetical protein